MYVDRLIVVVEPGRRSVETAYQIRRLADDLGLKKLSFVGNKLRSDKDKDFLQKEMPDFSFIGFMPYRQEIADADRDGRPPFEKDADTLRGVSEMLAKLKD